jgi:serine/threonine protein kinase
MSRVEQIESLFHEARTLGPGQDRRAWVQARSDDPEMAAEVIALLDAHTAMSGTGSSGAESPAAEASSTVPSGQFGPYRAVELLGHGGMSAVYLARRTDGNFDQTVALKIMAPHLANTEFLRRFEIERQLLASLNHHHITRLFDGGISSSGDPYLVTEYVDGAMIDDDCDQRRLNVSARVRIFLQVCEAVDYAHRNLIIHRDLKPANILVNSDGVVKLLDFGTASLLAASENVPVTTMRMMTPRYASPEQLRGERVNTATDVFSLGVVLYELVTGAWPFGDRPSMVSDLNRAAGNVSPRPLSIVATEASAEQRSASRDELIKILKGDISAVILKALENEPARRYESVREMAADLERFLEGRPVQARPQTVFYRGRKFIQRHWLPVSAAAIFVFGLLTATLVAQHQASIARSRYVDLRSLTTMLLFDLRNAITDLPGSVEAQRILVTRLVKSLDQMVGQSGEDSKLRLDLAEAYRQLGELQGDPYGQNLGDSTGALASLQKARTLVASELAISASNQDAIRTLAQIEQTVGEVYFGIGQSKEAASRLESATKLNEGVIKVTAAPPDLLAAAAAYQVLGDIYGQPGTSSLAEPSRAADSYRRTIELDQNALRQDPKLWRAQRGIGLVHGKLGDLNRFADPESALEEYKEALAAYDALPREEWNRPANVRFRARLLREIGGALRDLQQWAEAEQDLNQAIRMHEEVLAADPQDSRAKFDMAIVLESSLELYEDVRNPARAAQVAQRIVDLLDELVRKEPGNQLWRLTRAYHRYRLATEVSKLGDTAFALRTGTESLKELSPIADSAEATPQALELAAEAFARIEPASLRDPARAVRYAQRLMRLKPARDPEALYYLAIAQKSAGDTKAAAESAALALAAMPAPRNGHVPFTRVELEALR